MIWPISEAKAEIQKYFRSVWLKWKIQNLLSRLKARKYQSNAGKFHSWAKFEIVLVRKPGKKILLLYDRFFLQIVDFKFFFEFLLDITHKYYLCQNIYWIFFTFFLYHNRNKNIWQDKCFEFFLSFFYHIKNRNMGQDKCFEFFPSISYHIKNRNMRQDKCFEFLSPLLCTITKQKIWDKINVLDFSHLYYVP